MKGKNRMAGRKQRTQERLPGTDGGIKELDSLGAQLKAVRSERMELSKKEAEIAEECLKALKKNNMNAYHYGEVDLTIVPGKEKVSVARDKGGDE
jgi:hypothetical protein